MVNGKDPDAAAANDVVHDAVTAQQLTPTPCPEYFDAKQVFQVASALYVAYAGTKSHRNVLRGQTDGSA